MYWLVALMTLSIFGLIALGIYLEVHPLSTGVSAPRWLKRTVGTNVLCFIAAQIGLLLLGVQDVLAEPQASETSREMSLGMGLAFIGAGIPTALATIGAGIAVGPVGAASLAVLAEKPEVFGRSLVYLGLANWLLGRI